MSARTIRPVAFVFTNDSHDWQGGINYFRSLFHALKAVPDSSIRPVAFVGRKAAIEKYGFPANVQFVREPALDRPSPQWVVDEVLCKGLGIRPLSNRAIRRAGIPLLSHGRPTGNRFIRNIDWIPDFQHLHLKHFFTAKELHARDAVFRKTITASDALIVSSHSARKDLEAFAPGFGHKVHVLRFCAISPAAGEQLPLDIKATYGLRQPYFYLPNQVWAHKNHLTAIRALAELKDRSDAMIVCSGSLHDYRNPLHMDSLRAEIARRGLEERFRFLGMIPYPHIAQLMLQSLAVINPSLFEGWSTTVEESKALAVPLILSDIEVHREQCPNGEAVFFSPLAADELAARMRDALAKPQEMKDLASLQIAQDRHLARVRTFAQEYEAIVREVMSERA